MSNTTIGFLGFGKGATIFVEDIIKGGFNNIIAYDKFADTIPYGENIQQDADRLSIKLAKNVKELAEGADIILSMVIPAAAEEAAKEIAPYLKAKTYYVDLNSTAPMTKQKNYLIIKGNNSQVNYIDGCILGAIPETRFRTPILLCGDGALEIKVTMEKLGGTFDIVEGNPGDASAVKMLRSVFMKGIEVLFIETLHGASLYNIEKNVLDSIRDTFKTLTFDQLVNMLITTHSIHSKRRQGEMGEVIETLKAKNIDSTMTKATWEKLGWSSDLGLKDYFKNKQPSQFKDVIKAISIRTQEIKN